jgi:hypothetical protein
VVEEGRHSWLHEFELYRRTVASFLARSLDGPYSPDEAADRAAAAPALRIPEPEEEFTAVAAEPGGLRSLLLLAAPNPPVPSGVDDGPTAAEAAS